MWSMGQTIAKKKCKEQWVEMSKGLIRTEKKPKEQWVEAKAVIVYNIILEISTDILTLTILIRKCTL
jgi:hypothetical protein